jgi:hypothetical protein
MSIDIDEKSNVASANTIIGLLPRQGFAPTGELISPIDDRYLGMGAGPGPMRRTVTAMNGFLATHPGDRPSDYFLGLGMACKPAASSTAAARCEIDLPIQVHCSPRNMNLFPPHGAPIPEELQKPIPARLYWQVDVSPSALLGVQARVLPIPGGRLCHR